MRYHFLGESEVYRGDVSIFGLRTEISSLDPTNTVFGAKKFCHNMKYIKNNKKNISWTYKIGTGGEMFSRF